MSAQSPGSINNSYKVKTKDTLESIAESIGATVEDILGLNPGLDHPDNLRPGDILSLGSFSVGVDSSNKSALEPVADLKIEHGVDLTPAANSAQSQYQAAQAGNQLLASTDGNAQQVASLLSNPATYGQVTAAYNQAGLRPDGVIQGGSAQNSALTPAQLKGAGYVDMLDPMGNEHLMGPLTISGALAAGFTLNPGSAVNSATPAPLPSYAPNDIPVGNTTSGTPTGLPANWQQNLPSSLQGVDKASNGTTIAAGSGVTSTGTPTDSSATGSTPAVSSLGADTSNIQNLIAQGYTFPDYPAGYTFNKDGTVSNPSLGITEGQFTGDPNTLPTYNGMKVMPYGVSVIPVGYQSASEVASSALAGVPGMDSSRLEVDPVKYRAAETSLLNQLSGPNAQHTIDNLSSVADSLHRSAEINQGGSASNPTAQHLAGGISLSSASSSSNPTSTSSISSTPLAETSTGAAPPDTNSAGPASSQYQAAQIGNQLLATTGGDAKKIAGLLSDPATYGSVVAAYNQVGLKPDGVAQGGPAENPALSPAELKGAGYVDMLDPNGGEHLMGPLTVSGALAAGYTIKPDSAVNSATPAPLPSYGPNDIPIGSYKSGTPTGLPANWEKNLPSTLQGVDKASNGTAVASSGNAAPTTSSYPINANGGWAPPVNFTNSSQFNPYTAAGVKPDQIIPASSVSPDLSSSKLQSLGFTLTTNDKTGEQTWVPPVGDKTGYTPVSSTTGGAVPSSNVPVDPSFAAQTKNSNMFAPDVYRGTDGQVHIK